MASFPATVIIRHGRQHFTTRGPSSCTRHCWVTLSRIAQDSRLQPPVGVWVVLSPSVAGRPLRPATDRCFGEPLPHQPANQSSAAPLARGPCGSPSFFRRTHAVLANLSAGCPPRADTFRCITHPFATRRRREASFSPRYRSTCMCKAFRQRSI